MSTPSKKGSNENIELKTRLKELEDRLNISEAKNKQLEYRVTKLEASNINHFQSKHRTFSES